MVAQLTAVPVFVAPVLASHHGVAKTAAALASTLNVFNGLGVPKPIPTGLQATPCLVWRILKG